MPNDEDFFSPEQIDERLEMSRGVPGGERGARKIGDQDLLLLQDLHAFFGKEATENTRSLQHVWEQLAERNASRLSQNGSSTAGSEHAKHLRVLKPRVHLARPLEGVSRRLAGRRWVALVASLFLCIMVTSMLIVHHALPTWGASSAAPTSTPISPIPGYAYPGKKISALPASSSGFSALSWASDSKHLALITQNTAWTWNLTTGEYNRVAGQSLSDSPLQTLSWSPSGSDLALGTNPVEVVDPDTGNSIFSFAIHAFWPAVGNDYQAVITALAWSPDGKSLAIAAQRANNGCVIQIWNVEHPDLLANSIECDASDTGVTSLSWSADGAYIASTDGQKVQVWLLSLSSDRPVFEQPLSSATDVAWSPENADWLAFVNAGRAQIWSVASGTLVNQYGAALSGGLTWSPDGNYTATASGSQIAIWDAQTGAHLYTYAGDMHMVSVLSWSPDGKYLAAGDNSSSSSHSVSIWST